MTNDAIHEALINWIARITGKVTIAAYQSGPRPAEPYIMVTLTGTNAVRDYEQLVEYSPDRADEPTPGEDTGGDPIYADITATPVIETEWRFSVHAYGGVQATDHLRPLESARRLSQILEPLYPSLLIHETSQIRDLSERINEAWEQRANVDVFVRGLTRDGFVIDTIDDIEGFTVTREGTN